MMKHEFEQRIGAEVTEDQYRIVEEVYMNSELGKDGIAQMWRENGYYAIESLYYRKKADDAEHKSLTRAVELFDARERLREERDAQRRSYMEIVEALADAKRELREARAEMAALRQAVEEAHEEEKRLRDVVAHVKEDRDREHELRETCEQALRCVKKVLRETLAPEVA